MKTGTPFIRVITIILGSILLGGCGTASIQMDKDPVILKAIQNLKPLRISVALGPVLVSGEAGGESTGWIRKDRHTLEVDTQAIQKNLIEPLARFPIFSRVEILDPPKDSKDIQVSALLQAAANRKAELLLVPRLDQYQDVFKGRNSLWPLNLFLWFMFYFPSWFLPDEDYGVEANLNLDVYSVRTGIRVHVGSFKVDESRALIDFERGGGFWNMVFGIVTIPGSLDADDWKGVAEVFHEGVSQAFRNGFLKKALEIESKSQKPAFKAGLDPATPRGRALIASLERFDKKEILPVTGVVRDGRRIAKRLPTAIPGVGIPDGTISHLVNPKKEILMQAVRDLGGSIRPEDTGILYIAGRGTIYRDKGGKWTPFILPGDVDVDDLDATAISVRELVQQFGSANKGRGIILLDMGWDGSWSGRSFPKGAGLAEARLALEGVDSREDVAVLFSAAPPGAAAYGPTPARSGNGLFMSVLLRGLKKEADLDENRNVTLGELKSFLWKEVPRVAKEEGRVQIPLFKGGLDEWVVRGLPPQKKKEKTDSK